MGKSPALFSDLLCWDYLAPWYKSVAFCRTKVLSLEPRNVKRIILTDKSFWDHVTDWFKVLLRSGIPALLIGLGWLESFVGGIYTSGSWNTSPAFYVVSGTGIMMIALGVWL